MSSDYSSGDIMKRKLINKENGSISILCSILSIGIVLGIQEYWSIINSKLDPKAQILLIGICAFFVIITTIFGLHTIFTGEKSSRQLKRTILKERSKLAPFLRDLRTAIHELEKNIKYTSSIMNPKGFEILSSTKGLLSSLESRIARVNELLSTNDEYDIYDAYNLMFSDVTVVGDSLVGLITTDDDSVFSYDDIRKEFTTRLKLITHYLPTAPQKKRARVATA